MRALFPGSFDPVTCGHLDLIRRVAAIADSVVVAVAVNIEKRPLFSEAERLEMLREVCRPWPHVEVHAFQGLVVEAARAVGANAIVRGLRSGAESDHELQMALANRQLGGIETLWLPASPELTFVSSTLVKEVARFGGAIDAFVPQAVAARVRARLGETSANSR